MCFCETITKLTKKYQPQILGKVLSKNSNHSITATEIDNCYNELRYSEHSKSDKEIGVQYKNDSRNKLIPRKRTGKEQKTGKGIKIVTPNNLLTKLPALLAQIKS